MRCISMYLTPNFGTTALVARGPESGNLMLSHAEKVLGPLWYLSCSTNLRRVVPHLSYEKIEVRALSARNTLFSSHLITFPPTEVRLLTPRHLSAFQ